jgi:hypothetical protein
MTPELWTLVVLAGIGILISAYKIGAKLALRKFEQKYNINTDDLEAQVDNMKIENKMMKTDEKKI